MSQPVNFAFIGCGRVASRHEEAIRAAGNARLVAVCDLDDARATGLGSAAGVPSYGNYHEMLSRHPEIEVVSVITPSGMHAEHASDVIARYAKHVVIEKPFVMTPEQGEALQRLATSRQVQVFPIFQNRFNRAVQHVLGAMAKDGPLGRLRVGTVRMRWCRPQRYYDQSRWRGTWAMDGGALTNQGIHYIDLLRYLCGEPKRVNAVLATLGAQLAVEDTAVATLEFESGALGVIEIMTSARDQDFEASVSCVCERGLAVIAGIATNQLVTFSPDPAQGESNSEHFPTIYGFGHNEVMRRVSSAVRGQGPAPIAFDDGMRTIRLLHAIYRSDEKQSWVDFSGPVTSSRLGTPDESIAELYRTPAPVNPEVEVSR